MPLFPGGRLCIVGPCHPRVARPRSCCSSFDRAALHADQNLLAPNLTAIGKEFGFSRAEIDQRLGADVNLMFWMLGGVVTLFVGYLTDRADLASRLPRKHRLLFVVAFLGQAACLASGLVKTHDGCTGRALTGLGIGGSFR